LGHSGRYAEDFPNAETPNKVIATKDDLARANLFQGTRPKVIDLSRRIWTRRDAIDGAKSERACTFVE